MQNELRELGLTDGEIKVFLALFDLGLSTKTPIAKKSKVSQSKVYEILDRLIEKGLVSEILKNNVKHFQAELPSRLKDYLNNKKKKLEFQEKIVQDLIPQLEMKRRKKEGEYSAVVFKGVEGIKTALREMLDEGNEFLAMGVRSSKKEVYNRAILHWHNKRIKKKINARVIFSEKGDYLEKYKKMKFTKIKYLPDITPSAVGILGERVIICTFEEELNCLLIKSKDVSDSFKQFFESLWKI